MRRAKWSIYLLSLVIALAFGIGVSEPAEAAAGWTSETGTLIITSAEDYDTLQPHYREQATTLVIKADVEDEDTEGGRKIPDRAFENFTALKNVVIETTGTTKIGDRAFSGCTGLTSFTIPRTVTTIGNRAFSGCKNLASIALLDSVTSIGDYAFSGCEKLTSIALPDSVTELGQYAFENCTALESVTLSQNLKSVSMAPFSGCTGIESFDQIKNLPKDIPSSFLANTGFKTLELSAEQFTSIGSGAFSSCQKLTTVSIDPGIALDESIFANCTSLTTVTLPDELESIDAYMFSGCTSLATIKWPENVKTIGNYAFYGCTGLSGELELPDSLETIGSRAFMSCSNLTEIKIPATVTSVGENAFTGCSGLTSVEYTQHLDLTKAGILETVTTWTVQPDNDHHDWSLSGWEWAEDYSSATATFTCSKDYMKDHIEKESATITSSTTPATCTTDGSTTYTASVTFYEKDYTTQQTEVLTKLGHQWSNWTSNNDGTHTRSCQRSGCDATETAKCSYVNGVCTDCGASQITESISVTDVILNHNSLSLTVGGNATLTATVLPENATDKTVSWASDNEAVAKVDREGTVSAVGAGTATITATAGDVSASCAVTVTAPTEPEEPTEPETPSTPSTPSQPTTPSEPEEPSGPSTGDSEGWDGIRDEIAGAEDGDTITIDMNGETEVPAEIFEEVAGKDVTIEFDMGDGVKWAVKGTDIPADARFSDLDLGVSMNTDGIPVDVINAITGEATSVQITLAHDGAFGFALTLSAPLGEENAGYWANLYHYNEDAEAMDFETAALIGDDGTVKLRLTHASQYAIVIDDHSHAPVTTLPFTDVNADDWFYDPVVWAYDEGLMTGTSATTFEPNTSTTRAMIVAILNRLEGGPTADGGTFTDVHTGDWYAEAVNWAASEGIVAGFEDGTFRPNDPITREQMAAILYNYAQWKGLDVSARADLSRYSDQPSEWAEDVSRWAVAEGLLTGITEDTLAPQASATRAQVAAIFQRFLSE